MVSPSSSHTSVANVIQHEVTNFDEHYLNINIDNKTFIDRPSIMNWIDTCRELLGNAQLGEYF